MTDVNDDKGPTLMDRAGVLIDELRWLCGHLYRSELRHSSLLTEIHGGFVNSQLFAGGVNVPANGFATNYHGKFAAVTVSDPNGLGPIAISTDGSAQLSGVGSAGPGSFVVKKNCHGTVPLSGNALQIFSATPGLLFVVVYVRPQPFFMAETP